MKKIFGKKFLGIIEDTENGHQKYESLKSFPVNIYSVARSPLKNPEDCLVGQSIVFSTEVVGDYIYLVQAEIIVLIKKLINPCRVRNYIQSAPNEWRNKIALHWLQVFNRG